MRNFVLHRKGTVMKITKKSIVKLIISLSLVLSLMLSMSSCEFKFSFESFFDDSQNGDGNDITNPPSTEPGDLKPEFYPGSGSGSIENVSAENRTLLSTVSIVATFGATPAAGSGVIYKIDKAKGDAYIVTNYHVVYYDGIFDECVLYLYGMENKQYAIPATFVGGSLTNDIAVLKVTGSEVIKNSYAIAAPFADSENVRVFDATIAVGNPEGYGISATTGIISVESESIELLGADGSLIKLRVMRTDAAINLGNSGGGLYNENGEIIGIVCAKRTGEDVDNFGYAIPSNLAKNLIDNVIDLCDGDTSTQVCRPLIGITVTASVHGLVVDAETGEMKEKHVTTISDVSDSCKIADKIAAGDIINSVKINEKTTVIERYYQVPDTMFSARVGDTVTLNITREEQSFDVSFTITEDMISKID